MLECFFGEDNEIASCVKECVWYVMLPTSELKFYCYIDARGDAG